VEAHDLVGSFRAAADLAGCDKNTVQDHVRRRVGRVRSGASAPRASVIDAARSRSWWTVRRGASAPMWSMTSS
jgi:hypothetical protein